MDDRRCVRCNRSLAGDGGMYGCCRRCLSTFKGGDEDDEKEEGPPSWACAENTSQHGIVCRCGEYTDSPSAMMVTVAGTANTIRVYHTTGHYTGSKPLFAQSGEHIVHIGNYAHPSGTNKRYVLVDRCEYCTGSPVVLMVGGKALDIE